MKYYIIHVKNGRRDGAGYSVLVRIKNGDEAVAIETMKEKGYFDWMEDICDSGYVKEIGYEEYELLKAHTHCAWEDGCMLRNKLFAAEDFERAKELSYKNWNQCEEEQIGFTFERTGQWITNPFVDSSGIIAFDNIEAMYEYYGRDSDGMWDLDAREKVYVFIRKMLSADIFTEKATKKVSDHGNVLVDYTLYENKEDGSYVFVKGDKELFAPVDSEYDHVCDTYEEAMTWFNNYLGNSKELEKYMFSSGNYMNLTGSKRDVFVIFNEANASPTTNEYILLQAVVTRNLQEFDQKDTHSLKKALEKAIEETNCNCVACGVQILIVERKR